MPKVFLSHNYKDKKIVINVKNYLRQHLINAWLDKDDLQAGSQLRPEIVAGIHESDYFMLFVSNNYLASDWCTMELEVGQQKLLKKEIKIIPVLLEDRNKLNISKDTNPTMHDLLERTKYIDFDEYNREEGNRQIVDAIRDMELVRFEPVIETIVENTTIQVIKFKTAQLPDDFLKSWSFHILDFWETEPAVIKEDIPVAFNGKGPNWLYGYLAIPFKNLNDVYMYNKVSERYICIYSKKDGNIGKVLKQS